MSLLGDVVSSAVKIGEDLSHGDIGGAVGDAAKAALPDEYDWMGDALAVGVDAYTGNYAAAAEHGLDLAEHFLPKEFGELRATLGPLEPGPPGETLSAFADRALDQAKTNVAATIESKVENTAVSVAEEKLTSDASAPKRQMPSVKAQNAPAAAPESSATSSSATTESATSGAAKTDGGTGSKGTKAAADFIASFADPEELMTAIKNGKIPDDIANSPTGMMVIQQKLGDMQRMFALMSQMMQAMHEMEMGVVRNVRA